MRKARLFLAGVLLATTAAPAMVPPDLADAARRIGELPARARQGSESERLKGFFDLYWFIRMRELPDLATYVGYPGVDDRLPDRSPEMLALFPHPGPPAVPLASRRAMAHGQSFRSSCVRPPLIAVKMSTTGASACRLAGAFGRSVTRQ
jgi:hypothetical protein